MAVPRFAGVRPGAPSRAQKIEKVRSAALLTSMYLRGFQGESFSVPMVALFTNCHVFQENRILLAQQSYDVQSLVSVDSFRTFVGVIGGTEPDISDDNASDPALLSGKFKFTTLSTAVADWRAMRASPDANTILISGQLDEWLQAHDRVHQAASESESERVKLRKAVKDIDVAAEQRRALSPGMCALETDIGGLRATIAELVRRQMQEQDDWKAAIGDVPKKATVFPRPKKIDMTDTELRAVRHKIDKQFHIPLL